MSNPNIIKLSIAVMILFTACTQPVQKGIDAGNTTSAGQGWKKQVARIVSLQQKEDTVVHHLKDNSTDSSLILLVINALKAGQLTAYSNVDRSFTTKLTAADLSNMTASRTDTIVITDPVTGNEMTKVITRDFNYDMIYKYRILENWTYDPATGRTDIQIAGIAPIKEIYGDDGVFRGVQAMFWLKYDDIHSILDKYAQYHPNYNLNTVLWNDYFLSEVKPEPLK